MTATPRVVFLTGPNKRHRWAARRLAERLDVVGVLCEAKASASASPVAGNEADAKLSREHFAERDRVEGEILGDAGSLSDLNVRIVANGTVNDGATRKWIDDLSHDVLVLYGCSLIGNELLAAFPERIVNLHLGLSPYYRGSATNFWPLFHGEPECIGATIHLATSKIDGGPMLAQIRPEARSTDRVHELGTRALAAGVELLPTVVERYLAGSLRPVEQAVGGGRVCRRRDFSADALRVVHRKLDDGMMRDYVTHQAERCRAVPIHTLDLRKAQGRPEFAFYHG